MDFSATIVRHFRSIVRIFKDTFATLSTGDSRGGETGGSILGLYEDWAAVIRDKGGEGASVATSATLLLGTRRVDLRDIFGDISTLSETWRVGVALLATVVFVLPEVLARSTD